MLGWSWLILIQFLLQFRDGVEGVAKGPKPTASPVIPGGSYEYYEYTMPETGPTSRPTSFRPTVPTTLRPSTRLPTLKPTLPTLSPTLKPSAGTTTPKPTTIAPTTSKPTVPSVETTLRPTIKKSTPAPVFATKAPTNPTNHPITRRPTHSPVVVTSAPITPSPTHRPSVPGPTTRFPTPHPTALSQLDLFLMVDLSESVLSSGLSCYFETGEVCWSIVCDFVTQLEAQFQNAMPYSASDDSTDTSATGLRVYLSAFSYSCGAAKSTTFQPLTLTNDALKVQYATQHMYSSSIEQTCGDVAVTELQTAITADQRLNRAVIFVTDGHSLSVQTSGVILQSLASQGIQVFFITAGDVNAYKVTNLLGITNAPTAEQDQYVAYSSTITGLTGMVEQVYNMVINAYVD